MKVVWCWLSPSNLHLRFSLWWWRWWWWRRFWWWFVSRRWWFSRGDLPRRLGLLVLERKWRFIVSLFTSLATDAILLVYGWNQPSCVLCFCGLGVVGKWFRLWCGYWKIGESNYLEIILKISLVRYVTTRLVNHPSCVLCFCGLGVVGKWFRLWCGYWKIGESNYLEIILKISLVRYVTTRLVVLRDKNGVVVIFLVLFMT